MSFQLKHAISLVLVPAAGVLVPMLSKHAIDWWVVGAAALAGLVNVFVDSPTKTS
jgi:hypothetical protein